VKNSSDEEMRVVLTTLSWWCGNYGPVVGESSASCEIRYDGGEEGG
jgi:hypothetical protein